MNRNIARRIIQTFSSLFIQGTLLFLSAWTLNWPWAWTFIILGVLNLAVNWFVLPEEVIEERGKKKDNVKRWDKILNGINVFPLLGMYILSGLDYRFNWSGTLHYSVNIAGLFITYGGSMLFTWSMVSNRFFSTMVRIQKERDHTVATGGPYKYIRHPGYVGFIAMSAGTPIALGSIYALSMALIVTIIMIIRTWLEDNTLKAELTGYEKYAQRVRYRLIPYIW